MTSLMLAVLVTLVAALVVAWTWVPTGGRVLLRSTARKADLAPPAQDPGAVVRRLQQRTTAATAGLVAGVWVTALLVPADPAPGGELAGPGAVPLVIGGGYVGVALAAAVFALVSARRAPKPDAPRLARSREVALGDYVNGVERWGTVVTCLLPAAAGLVLAVLLADPGPAGLSPLRLGLITLVPPALLVLSVAAGTVVLAAPQTVTSPVELAWDDALRSQALRDIVCMPMYAGLVAVLWLGVAVAGSIPDQRLATGAVGLWIMAAVGLMVVLLVVTLASHPARHFRRRLWPVERHSDPVGSAHPVRPDEPARPAGPRR